MLKAVITGDIIQSTQMKPDSLFRLFNLMEKELNSIQKEYDLGYEIYRGDSFQCLIHRPLHSLRVALLIKTFIRSQNLDSPKKAYIKGLGREGAINIKTNTRGGSILDARMSIGIGEVDALSEKLATSNGIAFQLSGRLLDQLKDLKQHFILASDDKYNKEWQTESVLLDAIISKTSSLQCQVLYNKLKGLTEMEIAKVLNIGQSAVNQRSNSGNWNAINAMVKRFEEVYTNE